MLGRSRQVFTILNTNQTQRNGKDAYTYDNNDRDNIIGRGEFGNVWIATRNYDKQKFAIKIAKEKYSAMT